jgi:hypothetical protein
MALTLPKGSKGIPINLGGQFASLAANVAAIKFFCYYICLATMFLHYCFLVMKQATMTNFGSLVARDSCRNQAYIVVKKDVTWAFFPPSSD